jgi:hypothetical protein
MEIKNSNVYMDESPKQMPGRRTFLAHLSLQKLSRDKNFC